MAKVDRKVNLKIIPVFDEEWREFRGAKAYRIVFIEF